MKPDAFVYHISIIVKFLWNLYSATVLDIENLQDISNDQCIQSPEPIVYMQQDEVIIMHHHEGKSKTLFIMHSNTCDKAIGELDENRCTCSIRKMVKVYDSSLKDNPILWFVIINYYVYIHYS